MPYSIVTNYGTATASGTAAGYMQKAIACIDVKIDKLLELQEDVVDQVEFRKNEQELAQLRKDKPLLDELRVAFEVIAAGKTDNFYATLPAAKGETVAFLDAAMQRYEADHGLYWNLRDAKTMVEMFCERFVTGLLPSSVEEDEVIKTNIIS